MEALTPANSSCEIMSEMQRQLGRLRHEKDSNVRLRPADDRKKPLYLGKVNMQLESEPHCTEKTRLSDTLMN